MSLEARIEALESRLHLFAGRATLDLVDDAKQMQIVQITALDGETRSEVERFQNYGFTSVPLADTEAVAIFLGGNRDHGVVVATDDRAKRVKDLQEGEVCIYTHEGDEIRFKKGNEIEVTCATKVTVTCPSVEMSGTLHVVGEITTEADVSADGEVSDGTRSMSGDRTIYNGHTHAENGDGGGTTDPPGATQ